LKSQLLLLDLRTMQRHILLSAAPEHKQFWFPSIDGSRVVYGTVELSASGLSDENRVFLLELNGGGPPTRLDTSGSAAEPVIKGDDVIWKESDPSLNFLVAGDLIRYSISAKTRTAVTLPTAGPLGFTDPSIGASFATAWASSLRDIYLLNLHDGSSVKVIDLGPATGGEVDTVSRPHLSGELLAYIFGPAKGDLELRWVLLHSGSR
jgi:hypothetical protein